MDENALREKLRKNLIRYRKVNGYTQADLAQKINYSDKSISKWERGEGVPDVFVLAQLAQLYRITVGELLGETSTGAQAPEKALARTRWYIQILSVGLVWLAVLVAYALLNMLAPLGGEWWLAFIYGLPVSSVVLTVFANVWQYTYRHRLIVSSGIIWGVAVSLHVTFRSSFNTWMLYLVAGLFQLLWILWHRLIRHYLKKK